MTTLSPALSSVADKSADRVYNFSAGPSVLPESVLRQAQNDLWNIFGSGIGILEHSHRGPAYDRVLAEALEDVRDVGNVPDDYDIMFVQGGATTQCFMVPMNFAAGKKSDYFLTGKWASDSVKEAQKLSDVNIVASSKETKYDRIPDCSDWKFTNDAVYCHITSNNTIAGTQWKNPPEHPGGAWIACDASSDIFSCPIDFTKYGMVYAGAQKNLGPAGTVLVIAKKDVVASGRDDLPEMLKYKVHAAKESRYNTPPTFGIYLIGQVIKWIRAEGGTQAMAERNEAKARIIYDFLDESEFYKAHAQTESRSLMNITFTTPSAELDSKFIDEAAKKGLDGLAGHRSLGGMRASIYNAFPAQGCVALVDFMKEFELANKG